MRRLLFLGLAALCLIAGLFTLPLPLPTGLLLIVIGLALLLAFSPRMLRRVRRLRRRYPAFEPQFRAVESILPGFIRRVWHAAAPRRRDDGSRG